MKFDITAGAQRDIREAAAYYREISEVLEGPFVEEAYLRMKGIRQHPLACRIVRQRSRRANLPCFPYCLLYSVEGDVIWVLAVLHQARHPRHFFGRLP